MAELPKSRTGVIHEEADTVVPLVLKNLKLIRSKPATFKDAAKFSATDLHDFNHDNELLELAESFIATIELVCLFVCFSFLFSASFFLPFSLSSSEPGLNYDH
jgi:hypothetical protein